MFEKSTSDARPEETNRCQTGAGKCFGTTLDNTGNKQAALTANTFCDPCTAAIRRIISHLDADWDALNILISQHQTSQGEKVRYTANPGIPLNATAEAKQVDLIELADLATDMITAHTGDDHTPATSRRRRLEQAQTLITTHLDTLTTIPADWVLRWDRSGETTGETPTTWTKPAPKTYVGLDRDGNELDGRGHRYVQLSGADILLELWKLHDTIRGLFGARKQDMRKRYPMPCHGCGAKSLYRQYGQDLITCTNCPPNSEGRRGWTEEQYNRLAGLTRFHLKVVEDNDMQKLDEQRRRTAAAEARADALEQKLAKIAEFAGRSIDDLMADIDKATQTPSRPVK